MATPVEASAPTLQGCLDRVEELRESGDIRGLAGELASMAKLHLELGSLDAAAKAAREAEQLYRDVFDRRGEAELLLDVVMPIETARHAPRSAYAAARSAVELLHGLGERERCSAALQASAEFALRHGQAQEALVLLEEAIQEREQEQQPGAAPAATGAGATQAGGELPWQLLELRTRAKLAVGDLKGALEDSLDCIAAGDKDKEKTDQDLCRRLLLLSEALICCGAGAETLQALHCVFSLFAQSDSDLSEFDLTARSLAAEAHSLIGDFESAWAEARTAWELCQEGNADVAWAFAKTSFHLGKLEDSLPLLRQAIQLYWQSERIMEAASCLHSVVEVRLRRCEVLAARQAAEAARIFSRNFGDKHAEGVAVQVLAAILLKIEFFPDETSSETLDAQCVGGFGVEEALEWQTSLSSLDPIQSGPQTAQAAALLATKVARAGQDRLLLAACLELLGLVRLAVEAWTSGSGAGAKAGELEMEEREKQAGEEEGEAESLAAFQEALDLRNTMEQGKPDLAWSYCCIALAQANLGKEKAALSSVESACRLASAEVLESAQQLQQLLSSSSTSDIKGSEALKNFEQHWLRDLALPRHLQGFGWGSKKTAQTALDLKALHGTQVFQRLRTILTLKQRRIDYGAANRSSTKYDAPEPKVLWNHVSFPWHIPKPEDEIERNAKKALNEERPFVGQPEGVAVFLDNQCRRCSQVTDVGASGQGPFEGLWYCAECWEVWRAAQERIVQAQDHRREIRRRQKEAGGQRGPETSDDEESEPDMVDRSGKGLGRGAVPMIGRKSAITTKPSATTTAAGTLAIAGEPSPRPPPPNDENTDRSNLPGKGLAKGNVYKAEELQELSLFKLLTLVKTAKIDSSKVEAAMDGDDPKAVLRALLTAA